MSKVGDRIKEFRTKKNLKIKEILEGTDCDRTTYWRYENGESEVDINFVCKLVKKFPISAYWLLTGDPDVNMEWGSARPEIKFLCNKIIKDENILQALYHFLQWQKGNGKGDNP